MKTGSRWIPTSNRFVAFLDIMGFRDMVSRNSHEEILETMELFRLPIKKLKNEARKALNKESKSFNVFDDTIIRPVIFSDSVLLFSSDESEASFDNLVWKVTSIISHSLLNGIPIKGAISYGKQTADFGKSLYFGRPLIDAWELQNEIMLYGIVFHHSVEKYLTEKDWLEDFEGVEIVNYPTPLKQGIVNHYLLDWIQLTKDLHTGEYSKTVGAIPKLYRSVSGNPRRYVDNTMNFIKWKNENT